MRAYMIAFATAVLAAICGCKPAAVSDPYITYGIGSARAGNGSEQSGGGGVGWRRDNLCFDTHFTAIGDAERAVEPEHDPFGPPPRLTIIRGAVKYGPAERQLTPYVSGGISVVVPHDGPTELGANVGAGVHLSINEIFGLDAAVHKDFSPNHEVLEGIVRFTAGTSF